MRIAALAGALFWLVLGFPEISRAHERASLWTVRQAESVNTIRGMHVRVHECLGVGRGVTRKGITRYRHFSCVAGARAASDPYDIDVDTVGVLYVLHPLRRYIGPRSRHALTQVRFIGGPGIP
jgi:hypothetical protein